MRVSSKSSSVGSTQSVGASKPMASGPAPVAQSLAAHEVGDALKVSGTAQFIAVARARIAAVPDIRTAKVDAIKAKLDSNTYHPDGEAVADSLVREHTPTRRNP